MLLTCYIFATKHAWRVTLKRVITHRYTTDSFQFQCRALKKSRTVNKNTGKLCTTKERLG